MIAFIRVATKEGTVYIRADCLAAIEQRGDATYITVTIGATEGYYESTEPASVILDRLRQVSQAAHDDR